MMILDSLFQFLCHQDPARSFEVAGHLLPLCQRCTGLYLGLGLAFVIQLISGSYRQGLAHKGILYTHVACLLIMPAFGFHLLDPGPDWRLWTGLIYGNAIAYLLLPATVMLCRPDKAPDRYTSVSTIVFWIQFAFIINLAFWFPVPSEVCFYVVLVLVMAGLSGVVVGPAVLACLWIQKLSSVFYSKGIGHEQANH